VPYYLLQAVYTPEAWAAMVGEPQDRMEAIRPVLERMGGKLEQGWLAFGDHDVVVLCQMPDNVTAAAFSMAATAGGALKAVKTTPLLTMEESVGAMQKAGEAGYRPPGG
jgi:uncharacterized protein with GYD domain